MTTTSTSADLVSTVGEIYAAFGRGDTSAILDCCATDVAWEAWADSTAQAAGVPWLEARHGKDGTRSFFELLSTYDVHEFQVLNLMGGGLQVAAEIVIDATTPTGGRWRDEEIHLWTFNDHGQLARMRHYVDTAKHIAAAAGADTTK